MPSNDFFLKVYHTVRQIPAGRVTTYGAIARFLANGSAARMVGWAMNASHHQWPLVPAHRVVNRNGQLTGKLHFGEPCLMQQLLENEGVEVINDTIQNFSAVFWDPVTNLKELSQTGEKK
jgi:methylated-DNA-protein-cysteine methyltransferase related protein